ncbi:oligopeptide ABC transporter permease [Viridibacillus sp. FSL R5-0477]|uniref:Oligopeptide transport system permease n=1 Tax=Viridibacillus arenosi FSL R5-213 TaxID=1227360 RepID=W4F8U3_9BACL|nr:MULTISPECIES: oligopeptide ABC transporter permease [Viridibacillus]ETT88511.1 oligopeptide transport system permease [Viridibacillus arenosi FSL R5-213]OMC81072.1 peptide ABC transporter permease [Viridibacillus sp. FSL H8-0123]OMC85176.1 peptide ABC transporter permease [Viridibacillus sp. FSL H7-0596]OMC90133.1 peptide ABC transporter permease [Viridibacillus arenosi]
MWKTVLRRFLVMIPQLFVLSLLIFVMAKFMPGDPFTGLITPETDPNVIEELRIKAGFYDPWYVQYYNWITNAFQGDFGDSYTFKVAVSSLIGERALNTFWLSLLSVVLLYAIAIPLGILAGRYQDSLLDKGIVLYSFISYAIPTFVLSLIFLFMFGYHIPIFPTSGTVDVSHDPGTWGYFWSKVYHMLLPAITYALLATTGVIQYLRSEIIDSKSMDYVKTARSKGLPISKVYTKHIFRNSLLPIAAFFGFTITGLLGGSVFIETIFGYPGMGQLFISSIASRDYSVITTLVMLFGFLTLLGSLLSDIIMSIVDPRIRIE